jgi:hypothetical protein
MIVGYGASIGPNLVNNIRSGNSVTSIVADLAVDTTGFGLSVAGGRGVGMIGGALSGPVGAGVGDFFGSIITSVGWDVFIAPRARGWIISNIFGE